MTTSLKTHWVIAYKKHKTIKELSSNEDFIIQKTERKIYGKPYMNERNISAWRKYLRICKAGKET